MIITILELVGFVWLFVFVAAIIWGLLRCVACWAGSHRMGGWYIPPKDSKRAMLGSVWTECERGCGYQEYVSHAGPKGVLTKSRRFAGSRYSR